MLSSRLQGTVIPPYKFVKYTDGWNKITVPVQVNTWLKLEMPFQIYTIPRYPNVSVTDKWINIYELLYSANFTLWNIKLLSVKLSCGM